MENVNYEDRRICNGLDVAIGGHIYASGKEDELEFISNREKNVIGNNENLDTKAIHASIDSIEKTIIGNYDSAPVLYGKTQSWPIALGSPLKIGGHVYAGGIKVVVKQDPDFWGISTETI